MTPTNKGNYVFCDNCLYKKEYSKEKYPCYYSHKAIRGDVKFERDFKVCLKCV